MEEQDYIELNTLLAKLRAVCLKEIGNPDIKTQRRERNYKLVRNIDNIKKYTIKNRQRHNIVSREAKIMENGKVEMKLENFMDLINEREYLNKASDELDEILTILFDNARLSYNDKDLCFNANTILNGYLKGKEKHLYDKKIKSLLEQKEKEKMKK